MKVRFRVVQVARTAYSRFVDSAPHSCQWLTWGVDGAAERNGLYRR